MLAFRDSFIAEPGLRLANLIVTPILAGIAMALIGRIRSKRGKERIRLDLDSESDGKRIIPFRPITPHD